MSFSWRSDGTRGAERGTAFARDPGCALDRVRMLANLGLANRFLMVGWGAYSMITVASIVIHRS